MRMGQAARWLAIPLMLGTTVVVGEAATAQSPPAVQEARRLLDASDEPRSVDRAIGMLEAVPRRGESAEVQGLLAEAYYARGYDLDDQKQAERALDAAIAHADRARPRPAASVGGRKGLVQVEVQHVKAQIPRADDT